MLAQKHPQQQDRLEALHDFAILDTPPEKAFDEIVELASAICGTPMSLISLVDDNRQWFKARVGLAARETDLEGSICSHAILGEDILEIGDTLEDERTKDNPLVTGDPNLRFYAGVPLRTREGLPIGSLCVLSDMPHTLAPLQRQALDVLARQVMSQLELRAALERQKILQHEMDHRVKNSLQTVLSIVRVYRRTVTDEAALTALAAIERRLHAISELHAAMYSSTHVGKVNGAEFLSRIVSDLQASAPDGVGIDAHFAEGLIPSAVATALAVVISEFTANSIKHAFPDGREGRVTVEVAMRDGRLVLDCADDGVGLSINGAASGRDTLGRRIMEASVAQVGGEIAFPEREQGFAIRVML